MSFKSLFGGAAMIALGAIPASAQEDTADQAIQDVLHSNCMEVNEQIRDLEQERSALVETAYLHKLMKEPEQTQGINILLEKFSSLTQQIQDAGEPNNESATFLITRGLDAGPCSPFGNPYSRFYSGPGGN
jgi:hypothetical protein